ncbi:MAG: right-handed parallel beta-helix repeat-containing protein, partial [Candidatus Heimdallarchaeota archaeon]|nr:right-handed parallel beta-helix repeat-containing protein [Candidatus Heimdallarchaeota archaeon]
MKSRKSIIIVIVLLISVYSLNSYSSFAKDGYRELVQETNYADQEPIIILNDNNFTDYGFPGSGTESAPYIIDGYNIITDEEYGIKIWDTTKYFIVQNCYVDSGYYCIAISKVATGTALIQDNICVNSNDGIFIGSSNNTRVSNNYCANNYRYSIWVFQSSYVDVDGNTCINNSALNFAYNCIGCTARNNELFNEGLRIFENDIDNFYTYNIINNFVNNKVLGYYVNLEDVVFDTPLYGQLYLVNCKRIEIFNQNLDDTDGGVVLQNCEDIDIHHISCMNSGIDIYECRGVTISNSICSDNYWGISCVESSDIEITKNICNNNKAAGIFLRYSNRILVEENICSQNGDGIDVSWSDYVNITRNECKDNRWEGIDVGPSDFAFIYQNYCSNNTNGIYNIGENTVIKNNICLRNRAQDDYWYYYMNLQGFGIVSCGVHSSWQIINNTCNENKYGIGVSWASNGLISYNYCSRNEAGLLLAASTNSVLNNSFCENSKNGIEVIGFPGDMWWGQMNATGNDIIFNNICNNTQYGITLDAFTNQNLIQYNNFIYNSLLLNSQAEDNGTENIWKSNYWSDIEGSSYSIDGLANSEDSSPLDEPLVINDEEINIPPIERSTFHFNMFLLVFLCCIV